MTVAAGTSQALDRDDSPVALEVVTAESDTLRAMIHVDGALTERTTALLLSVIGTHVRAGRRYLRVDLERAVVETDAVAGALVQAHTVITGLGGMLVFDRADVGAGAILRAADLHVSPTG